MKSTKQLQKEFAIQSAYIARIRHTSAKRLTRIKTLEEERNSAEEKCEKLKHEVFEWRKLFHETNKELQTQKETLALKQETIKVLTEANLKLATEIAQLSLKLCQVHKISKEIKIDIPKMQIRKEAVK